jgi:hypothetical protein
MSETLFKDVRYDLGTLTKFVELGDIGLPDIQRPFVWKNAKVRDLFDSMYRGYPVGYLLLWQNALAGDSKGIGTDKKQNAPRLLIVDGQQRLTSLYAVLKGIPVVRENYKSEAIEIAFNPIEEKFEVADAAIRRDRTYISNISALWDNKTDMFELVADYISGLGSLRNVSDDETKKIRKSITRLNNLLTFPFTALELSSSLSEDQVAEVFVRINSKGTPLNQADFILTLMSVFWDEGRSQLESFCRDARKPPQRGEPSPYNHFIQPDPDQLLRVAVGLGFKRARLQYVYSILRGKDLETEKFSEERRIAQFEVLKEAQQRVLNLQYWHDFLKGILQAGYRSAAMITSQNNLIYAYVFYLIGRTEIKMDDFALRALIARWFFMSSLTGRYTGSPESIMEFDLARLRTVSDASGFARALETICNQTLTDDYWKMTLPNELATSSPRSPSLFAYHAALCLLGARALFSKHPVTDFLDPSIQAPRSGLERHHLFPKAHLKEIGIAEQRDTNQIANYALIEWGDNSAISKEPPNEYLPVFSSRFEARTLEQMYYWHALPTHWEAMSFNDFLEKRRVLIASVVSDGYKKLVGSEPTEVVAVDQVSLRAMADEGESTTLEFKSALRMNLHTRQADPKIELSCLKTIAGFLNMNGGTLIVGASDDGSAIGIEVDGFPNEDKMNLHFVNLIKDRMGVGFMVHIHPRFEDLDSRRIFVIECKPSRSPVFIKDGNLERFYIRAGASTAELSASQIVEFIKSRFS